MDTIKTFNNLIGISSMKKNPTNMPSLNQGNDFKEYQNKLRSQVNQINERYTEGFRNRDNSMQSQDSENESLNTLKTEYNNTLEEYKKLLEEVSRVQRVYGIRQVTTIQKQRVSQMETKLSQLSSRINSLTSNFQKNDASMNEEIIKNKEDATEYLNQIDDNKKSIATINMNSDNIDNILDDSDVVILQKNYYYLFFAILTAGTILISINVLRK